MYQNSHLNPLANITHDLSSPQKTPYYEGTWANINSIPGGVENTLVNTYIRRSGRVHINYSTLIRLGIIYILSCKWQNLIAAKTTFCFLPNADNIMINVSAQQIYADFFNCETCTFIELADFVSQASAAALADLLFKMFDGLYVPLYEKIPKDLQDFANVIKSNQHSQVKLTEWIKKLKDVIQQLHTDNGVFITMLDTNAKIKIDEVVHVLRSPLRLKPSPPPKPQKLFMGSSSRVGGDGHARPASLRDSNMWRTPPGDSPPRGSALVVGAPGTPIAGYPYASPQLLGSGSMSVKRSRLFYDL